MEILSIEQNLLIDQIKNRKTTLRIIKIWINRFQPEKWKIISPDVDGFTAKGSVSW